MALTNKNGLGAADAGCPITPQGDCVLNGMPVSCSIIRECDSVTGTLHYEYAMPYSTGNVNINVADTQGNLVGYNDSQGRFVDTADVSIASLTKATKATDAAYQLARAQATALAEGHRLGYTGAALAAYIARETAWAVSSLNTAPVVNTQAGQVTGAIVNTPQTTTNQQGTPGSAHVINTNASTNNGGSGGNNSVTPTGATTNTTGMNFSSLLTAGRDWWGGKTWGIDNKWLAVGAALAVALGGGYIGGKTRRGF